MAEEVLFKPALRPGIFDLIPRKRDQELHPDVSDGSECVAQSSGQLLNGENQSLCLFRVGFKYLFCSLLLENVAEFGGGLFRCHDY